MVGDILSYLADSLDKPGRAVRGILGGQSNEGLAFLPFSDSLGITNQEHAVSGEDLLRQHFGSTGSDTADSVLGFGMNVALDPTTYAGGFLGRIGGRVLGKGLEAAAAAKGPGYASAGEALMDSARKMGGSDAGHFLKDLMDHPAWGRASQELPPGTQYLGSGTEAMAFKTPAGDVIRMMPAYEPSNFRVADPAVLQPTRSVFTPNPSGYVPGQGIGLAVERTPFAQDIREMGRRGGEPIIQSLRDDLASRGIGFQDAHTGNVGMFNGKPMVIDPGAVSPVGELNHTMREFYRRMTPGMVEDAGAAGVPYASVIQAKEPGTLMDYLMKALGSESATRNAVESGMAGPQYQRFMGNAGMGLGASLGAF